MTAQRIGIIWDFPLVVDVTESVEHERGRLDLEQADQVMQELKEQNEIDNDSFIYSNIQIMDWDELLMTTYTPGPWVKGKCGGSVVNPNLKNEEPFGFGCDKFYGGKVICESVSPQNLALICAAPDLLVACKELIEVFYNVYRKPINNKTLDFAKTAIAKAEGCHD